MPYSPQTWIDGNASYPLSAARMGNIENGIAAAATTGDQGHRILTTAQRDALGAVTTGTMIYNSTVNRIQTYNGSAWVEPTRLTTAAVCILRKTAAQSITGSTWTSLTFGAAEEVYDPYGFHDTSTNTARITPNIAGAYLFVGNNYYASGAIGGLRLMKNAATYIGTSETTTTALNLGQTVSAIEFMNGTTDYVTLDAYAGSTVNTSTSAYPGFSCVLLGQPS